MSNKSTDASGVVVIARTGEDIGSTGEVYVVTGGAVNSKLERARY